MPDASTLARLSALPGVGTASGVASAEQAPVTGRTLPVLPELSGLLPWRGLRRGSTVAVLDATSLALALLAAATTSGSWAAVVGVPTLGVLAARELGVEIRRLALVPRPGAEFGQVTAALLDGVDLVVVNPAVNSRHTQLARRLSARARNRGAVLISLGSWPGADVELGYTGSRWVGQADGHGHLRERRVVVHASGRGAAAKPTSVELSLPGQGGAVTRTSGSTGIEQSHAWGVRAEQPENGAVREVG